MFRDFGAETDVKYPGLNGNQNKPLYGNFQSSGMHRLEEL